MPTRDVSELALLGFFLAISIGFFAMTTTFRSSSAQLFPRLTAGVIVAGVALLLVEDRLPEPLRKIVAEPVDLVDRDEFAEYESSGEIDGSRPGAVEDDVGEGTDGGSGETMDRDGETMDRDGETMDRDEENGEFTPPIASGFTARQFTFAAIAGYVGLAYVASILLVTPLFVLLYGYWHRQPRWIAVLLAALSVGVCLAFMSLANAPLDRSLLFPRGIL